MNTSAFKLINRTESAQLCERLQREAAQWGAEWLSRELPSPRVSAMPLATAELANEGKWTVYRDRAEGAAVAVTSHETSLRLRLSGTMDIKSADDATLHQLEVRAIAALLGALTRANSTGSMPEQGDYQRRGSGYVLLHCVFDDALSLHVLLWPQTVNAWLESISRAAPVRSPGLASRRDALGERTVTLEVLAGAAEISFDELRALSAGAVIKLDRTLDQPFDIQLDGGERIGAGHLGLHGRARAVQIIKTN